LTLHTLVQQEEIREITGTIRIRSKINLMEEAPKKLNAKAYVMTIKEEEALNQ